MKANGSYTVPRIQEPSIEKSGTAGLNRSMTLGITKDKMNAIVNATDQEEAQKKATDLAIKYDALGYATLDFGPLDFDAKLLQEVTFGTTKNTAPNIESQPGDGSIPLLRPADHQFCLPILPGLATLSRVDKRAQTRVYKRAQTRDDGRVHTSGKWDPGGEPVKPQDYRPMAWWG